MGTYHDERSARSRASWQSGNLPVLCLVSMRPQASLRIWKFIQCRQSSAGGFSDVFLARAASPAAICLKPAQSWLAVSSLEAEWMDESASQFQTPSYRHRRDQVQETSSRKKKPLFHTTARRNSHLLGMGP